MIGLVVASIGLFAPSACGVVDQADEGWALVAFPGGSTSWLAIPNAMPPLEGARLCPSGVVYPTPARIHPHRTTITNLSL